MNPLRLVFLTDHMKFSGGRKLMLEYAAFLKELGHEVKVLVESERGELAGTIEVEKVPAFDKLNIPPCDLIVATSPKEVRQAWEAGVAEVVHFSQGFEITDLEQRISGEALPARFKDSGWFHEIKLMKKRWSWKQKIKRFDAIYRLPTHLITISPHLVEILKNEYKRPVILCRNGINQKVFKHDPNWSPRAFSEENPMRIVNVGPLDVTYKGVATTIEAVKMARKNGVPIEFIRVTPTLSKFERRHESDYELRVKIPQTEMAELFRSCDLFIANSTEREGFGLPAMEALSCGLISILSSVSSYINFSERRDYCHFVPENDVPSTVKAISEVFDSTAEQLESMRSAALEVAKDYSHEDACGRFNDCLLEIIDRTKK